MQAGNSGIKYSLSRPDLVPPAQYLENPDKKIPSPSLGETDPRVRLLVFTQLCPTSGAKLRQNSTYRTVLTRRKKMLENCLY